MLKSLGTSLAPAPTPAPCASHPHPDGKSVTSSQCSRHSPSALSHPAAPAEHPTILGHLGFPSPSPSPGKRGYERSKGFVFSPRFPRAAVPRGTHLSRRAEPRPGRWQEGSAGSSGAFPSGASPAGATRWPQSRGPRRAPCPAPPAAVPAI